MKPLCVTNLQRQNCESDTNLEALSSAEVLKKVLKRKSSVRDVQRVSHASRGFLESSIRMSKAASWRRGFGEPVEGGFVTMWGWFRPFKNDLQNEHDQICSCATFKAFSGVSKSHASMQTHTHTQQSHSQMCRRHTPRNWVILDVLCHSVFLDPGMCVSLQVADKGCRLCTKSG